MKINTYFSILFLLGMWACQSSSPTTEESGSVTTNTQVPMGQAFQLKEQDLATLDIQMALPTRANRAEGIACTGQIEVPPQSLATLSVPVGGFVKEIRPYPGTFVRKGEVLAVLSHPDYIALQQGYLQAKAEGDYLQQEYQRQQNLVEQNAGTEKTLQKVKADYLGKQSELYALQAQLAMLGIDAEALQVEEIGSEIRVKAPFSGYVSDVEANYGKYVGPGEEICSMINKEHLHLELQVFEKDMYRVKAGQDIHFRVAQSQEAEPYQAEVHIVAQNVDPETRTIQVHGHMEEALSKRLKPGTFVNAFIFPESDSVWVLPESAWLEQGGRSFILLSLGERTFQLMALDKGNSLADGIVLPERSVIPEDAQVVIQGAESLYAELIEWVESSEASPDM